MHSQTKYSIASLSGIPALLKFIFRNRPLVLAYHGIYDGPKRMGQLPDTFVHIDDLRWQLLEIKQKYHVVDPEAFRSALAGDRNLPANSALVTFDDGYESFYRLAFPILDSLGIKAVVFIATKNVEDGTPFWFDLVWLFSRVCRIDDQAMLFRRLGLDHNVRGTEDPARRILYALKRMLPVERDSLVDELRETMSGRISEEDFPYPLFFPMSSTQICELAGKGVTFGGHSHTHTILTAMPHDMAYEDVRINKLRLESMTQRNVDLYAYPNGGEGDFENGHKRAMKNLGYMGAFSLTQRRSSVYSDPMDMSRFNVAPEDTVLSLTVRCTGISYLANLVNRLVGK